MIRAQSFLSLEASLTARLHLELRKATREVYAVITSALKARDFDKAALAAEGIDLSPVTDKAMKYMEYISNMAMLFGASRVTTSPGTSVVGLGYEKTLITQSLQSFATAITTRGQAYIRTMALQLIATEKSLAPGENSVHKANPYHDENGNFTTKDKAVQLPPEYLKALQSLASFGVKIAAPGSGRDREVVGAYYGAEVKLTDAGDTQTQTLNLLYDTLKDFKTRLGIDLTGKGITLLSRDPDAAGLGSALASVGGGAISLGSSLTNKLKSKEDWKAAQDYEKEHGVPWGVPEKLAGARYTDAAHREYSEGVVRHEIGHLLTTHKTIKALRAWVTSEGITRKDMKSMVSAYGASKSVEFIAESFALYTSSTYKKGALPPSVEAIMASMLVPHAGSGVKASYSPASQAVEVPDTAPDSNWFGGMWAVEEATRRVKKAERILKPFESFMDEAGKAYLSVASSLHTSRLSAYGFTAEADALGLTQYQINEQLDTSICPVCSEMHGKTFEVKAARKLLDVALRVTDPQDLKFIQPWPKQSKAGVAALRGMDNAELVAQGWHVPPFHPRCRGLLSRVGKVPPIVSGEVAQHDQYIPSKEDFKALGTSASDKNLATWNSLVGMSPVELVARLRGESLDTFASGLAGAESKKTYSGVASLSFAKNITLRLTGQSFGSQLNFDQAIQFKPDTKSLYLYAVEINAEEQASGLVKKYMRELYMLAGDMGMEKIDLLAGLDVGGYAWAKYGFKPTAEGWASLKVDVLRRVTSKEWYGTMNASVREVFDAVIASDDPSMIYALSDLGAVMPSGLSLGKEALLGTLWAGSLHLADTEAIERFLTYIGELK